MQQDADSMQKHQQVFTTFTWVRAASRI